jgi:hypothetical protein
MIHISNLIGGYNFNDAVNMCINLSQKHCITVVLEWSSSVVIFRPNDAELVKDVKEFYENQRVNNPIKEAIEIGRLLNS